MQRLPEMHTFDRELAVWPSTAGNGLTGLVLNEDANLRGSLALDAISYSGIRSLDLSRQGDIAYIRFRGRIEFNWTLDTCIVKEVKVRGVRHHFSLAGNVYF